jgi:subtilisin-like proprotein convertase family protein
MSTPSCQSKNRGRFFPTAAQRATGSSRSRLRVEELEQRTLLSTSPALSWTNPAALLETPAAVRAFPLGERPAAVPAGLAGRVDERLWSVVDHLRADLTGLAQQPDALALLAGGRARVNSQGQIQTYIHLANWNASAFAQLAGLGIAVEASSQAMRALQAWVPADRVDDVARLPAVRSIGLPDYAVPRTGSVTSAGDAIHRADEVRRRFAAQGIDGSGVRIGVISDGVSNRAQVAASPYFDLPTNITIDPARPGNGNEGTAMLEIIHDLAPEASLYFSGPTTSIEMSNAIDWMVSQGVNVIVDDFAFYAEPFFADGPLAQAVANAVARGVTYVTAAGNDAQSHYQAPYVQGSSSGAGFWHNFGGGDIDLTVTIPAGETLEVVLQWSDPFGGSGNDYDLYLFRPFSNDILAQSDRHQTGTQSPWEFLSYTNASSNPLTADLTINRFSGAGRELELFLFGASSQEYVTAADSIFGHAAVPAVLSVGAINAADSGHDDIAPYSSRGPSTIYTNFAAQTRTQRDSLDGAGIDGVQTKVGQLGHFSTTFLGTSAAAPHVAAIAALLLDANPSLTPAAVAAALRDTAVDLTGHGSGFDSTSGFGRFDALDALYRVFTPSASDLADASDTGLSPTDNLTADSTPTFRGIAPAGSYVRLYVDGQQRGAQQLGSNATTYSITTGALTAGVHQVVIRVAASSATPVANLSQASGALTVTIDPTAPGVDILDVSPDPRTTGVGAITLVFTEPVYNFNLAGLLLTRDGSGNLLTAAQTLSTGDNRTWTLGNLAAVTGTAGNYLLRVRASGSGISDAAGNILAADVSDAWQVLSLTGQIQGTVFTDRDGDGIRDAGEPGLPGWTVYLDRNNNGILDQNVVTVSSTDVPRTIPDLGTIVSTLAVNGLAGRTLDVDVTLTITHTWDSDLDVFLISPAGTRVELVTDVGSAERNFTGTTLDDEAAIAITAGSAPFSGRFRPESPLSAVDSQDPNGTWRLEITDDLAADAGALQSWSLTLTHTTEPVTTTNASGAYAFAGLNPGPYAVREVLPAGWVQSRPGSPDFQHLVSLAGGQTAAGRDFGNYQPGEIRGRVFHDQDRDGVFDTGEPGLAGWIVYLDPNNNGVLDQSVRSLPSADVPRAIPDLGTIVSTLAVNGLAGPVLDVNVTLTITHTWDSDLDVFLVSPAGTRVELFTDVGIAQRNFTGTSLDDEAALSITQGSAPFTGSYRPEGQLAVLDGQDPNGTWRLEITDDLGGDAGTLQNWSLTFRSATEPATRSAANGAYVFAGLNPGSYLVREVLPAGWIQSRPGGPTFQHAVALASGQAALDRDFGNYADGSTLRAAVPPVGPGEDSPAARAGAAGGADLLPRLASWEQPLQTVDARGQSARPLAPVAVLAQRTDPVPPPMAERAMLADAVDRLFAVRDPLSAIAAPRELAPWDFADLQVDPNPSAA